MSIITFGVLTSGESGGLVTGDLTGRENWAGCCFSMGIQAEKLWAEVRSMGEQLDLGFFVLCPVSDRWRNELELTLLHYSDDDHHGRAVLVGRVGSKGDCVNFIEVVVQG